MTFRMGDAIYPANLPPGLDAYAGYDAGSWPDFPAIAAAHPTSRLIEITPFYANRGQFLDVEKGDATPPQAAPYIRLRLGVHVWRPGIYASISVMPEILQRLNAAGLPRSSYRLWSAHYGGGKHICGPTTCRLGPQCDGTQWIDHGGWDESVLADDFFPSPIQVVVPATPPTPAPLNIISSTIDSKEGPMNTIRIEVPVSKGYGALKTTIPWPSVVSVDKEGSDPDADHFYLTGSVQRQQRDGMLYLTITGAGQGDPDHNNLLGTDAAPVAAAVYVTVSA